MFDRIDNFTKCTGKKYFENLKTTFRKGVFYWFI